MRSTKEPMKKILLVDDHKIILEGLKLYFHELDDLVVAGEASNGREAWELLESNQYDIVITDISMPQLDGIGLMEKIVEKYTDQKVLALSSLVDVGSINKMIALGAKGYVPKSVEVEEMLHAVREILAGNTYFSKEIYDVIVNHMARIKPKERLTVESTISEREKEVLRLIVQEYSNQEIADKLFISIRTVETHKRNLLEKTGCKNIAGLVMYAVERHIM